MVWSWRIPQSNLLYLALVDFYHHSTTNGIESFWALMKRGLHGTYHHVSVKHLGRYVDEFSGRHNVRPLDTQDQMGKMAAGMVGKRLTYADLIGPKDTRQPRMLEVN